MLSTSRSFLKRKWSNTDPALKQLCNRENQFHANAPTQLYGNLSIPIVPTSLMIL